VSSNNKHHGQIPSIKKYYHYWIAVIVIFGLLITTIIYLELKQAQDIAFRKDFLSRSASFVASIEQEIILDLEVLQFFKGFYDSSESVTSKEFNLFAARALSRHPSIQALEWVPRVPMAERAKVELDRKSQIPDFEIIELTPQGDFIRAMEREEYFPVLFVEPLSGNESALGFDLASNAARQEALLRARTSGQLALSASIKLIQYKQGALGFLAFVPVYQTNENRPDRLKGFVLGVFSIQDTITNVLSKRASDVTSDIYFEITDQTDPEQKVLLYSNHNDEAKLLYADKIDYKEQRISIGGRVWGVSAFPTRNYVSAHKKMTAEWVLLSGIAFTLFVFIYLIIIVKTTRKVQLLIEKRTRELHEVNKKMELLTLTDALTGVLNRRGFDQIYLAEFKGAIRANSVITLMIIDVDQFKSYNDHYGHVKGDECLKRVARAISTVPSRHGDVVARYGGEEFAVILPGTDDKEGAIAERCRTAIEQMAEPHEFSAVSSVVTASVGVATARPNQDSDPVELIERADKALFQAKEAGRNRVVLG